MEQVQPPVVSSGTPFPRTPEIIFASWRETLHSDTSRPFDKPTSGRIAVKVINHLGDEVMKVFRV